MRLRQWHASDEEKRDKKQDERSREKERPGPKGGKRPEDTAAPPCPVSRPQVSSHEWTDHQPTPSRGIVLRVILHECPAKPNEGSGGTLRFLEHQTDPTAIDTVSVLTARRF